MKRKISISLSNFFVVINLLREFKIEHIEINNLSMSRLILTFILEDEKLSKFEEEYKHITNHRLCQL